MSRRTGVAKRREKAAKAAWAALQRAAMAKEYGGGLSPISGAP